MTTIKNTLLVLLLVLCQWVSAQSPYRYVIDKTKGLPSNNVYDVFQDSKGFIWLTTNDGICRYDGLKFTSYLSDKQTSRSGSSISEDKYGRIWYSNFDGYLYYVANGKLQTLPEQSPKGYFSFGIIDDLLYVPTTNGLSIYDLKTLKLLNQAENAKETLIYSYVANGKYYMLGNYLYEFHGIDKVKKITLPNNFLETLNGAVIMQKMDKSVLFFSKNSPYYYVFDKNSFKKLKQSTSLGYTQNVSRVNGQIWLCTSTGAYLATNIYQNNSNYKQYFPDANISSVFKDNRDNYWFATLNSGVMLVPEFKNVMMEMPSRPIRLVNDKDGIVVSTEVESIYKVNVESLKHTEIYKGRGNHSINQLLVDTGTNELMFTSNTFNFLNENYKLTGVAYVAVKDVKKVDHKYYTFAASGYSGIFTKNPNLKSEWDSVYYARRTKSPNFNEASLINNLNGKSTIYNPLNKTIYYATNVGLYAYSKQHVKEIKYNNDHLFLRDLATANGIIYALATNGKIYTLSVNNKVAPIKFDDKQGIVSKIKIVNNTLYIFAASSVYEYDISNNRTKNVISLGADYEVSDVVFYGNKIVFSTAKGLLFPAENAKKIKFFTTIEIDNITVNGSVLAAKDLKNLSYDDNNININYALLAYSPSEKSPVYYRINNQKWNVLDEYSRSLNLNALSPGDYIVSFKTHSDNKLENKQVIFTIAKPFWLTHLFIMVIISLVLLTIYWLHRYKIAQNDKRNETALAKVNLENSLNQSKLKAIKSQMNPHFFYNALNTIQSYILANDKKQAVSYLSKFSVLTRTILEMSEKEYISLSEEIKTIGVYLDIEKARFDEDFDYEIICEEAINKEEIKIPTMLLQPYLENAIKHGLLHKVGAKKLKVDFSSDDNILSVTIDDNGIGRKKSEELNQIKKDKHQSFATVAIQNRIDLLNQHKTNKISIRYIDKLSVSAHPLGTTVIIEIPISAN